MKSGAESRWGIDQAAVYTRQFRPHIEATAAQTDEGRAWLHFLFYRITSDGVDVVRVLHILHERMDFERHLP